MYCEQAEGARRAKRLGLWTSCAQGSLEVWKKHMEEALAEPHSLIPNSQVTQPTAKTLKSHHTGTGVSGRAREQRALLLVLGWGSSLTSSVQPPQ